MFIFQIKRIISSEKWLNYVVTFFLLKIPKIWVGRTTLNGEKKGMPLLTNVQKILSGSRSSSACNALNFFSVEFLGVKLLFTIYIFFRTAVLRKLFGIRLSYKHCNFSRLLTRKVGVEKRDKVY